MTADRPALLALAVLLALGLVGSSSPGAVSAARRGVDPRAHPAAARLDADRASDRQLEDAVRDLDARIATQQASADAAKQAARIAELEVAAASAHVEASARARDALQRVIRDRAVAAYVSPPTAAIASELLSARDLGQLARKRELLDGVLRSDSAIRQRLRVVERELAADTQRVTRAWEEAALRHRQAEARLVALEAARAELAPLRQALDARMKDYLADADAAARDEATLVAYIQAHASSSPAARLAQRPPPGSAAPGGGTGGGPVSPLPIDRGGGGGRGSAAGFVLPVDGPITSEFGPRWGRLHAGIDIAASTGTPIRAARGGRVMLAGVMGGYGNVVVIDHGGGFSTLYGHQSRLAVATGQTVTQGQIIGFVGSTGNSTGAHLHFEARVNGAPQDPRRYL